MNENVTMVVVSTTIIGFSISIGLCFGSIPAGLAAFFGSVIYLGKQ